MSRVTKEDHNSVEGGEKGLRNTTDLAKVAALVLRLVFKDKGDNPNRKSGIPGYIEIVIPSPDCLAKRLYYSLMEIHYILIIFMKCWTDLKTTIFSAMETAHCENKYVQVSEASFQL